jgi:hypothetical protein
MHAAPQICDELLAEYGALEDDEVVHLLRYALRELHRGVDITRIMERAHERRPQDMDTASNLFVCYIRCPWSNAWPPGWSLCVCGIKTTDHVCGLSTLAGTATW